MMSGRKTAKKTSSAASRAKKSAASGRNAPTAASGAKGSTTASGADVSAAVAAAKRGRPPAASRLKEAPRLRRRRGAEGEEVPGRERLLMAAVRLVGTKGYAAASVRDIVQAAGVTAPTLYHHFGNKGGLYRAVARAGRERLDGVWLQVRDSGEPAPDRLRRLCRLYAAIQRESVHLGWAVERMLSDPAPAGPSRELRALAHDRLRQVERLVEEGVAQKAFRRCVTRHVALALLGAVGIATRSYLIEADGGRVEEDLDGMVAVILAGIAAVSR